MRSRGTRRRAGAAVALVGGAGLVAAPAGCGVTVTSEPDTLVAGKKLFVERCGSCHVLNRAQTKGTSGPDLDQSFDRALIDGFHRDSIKGIVDKQILYPN